MRSTLLHCAQQKPIISITSPITSHHPSPLHPYTCTQKKSHDPTCQKSHVLVPCVAVVPTRSICLRYRVGGAQWGVAPVPSPYPGKEAKQQHPRDPINHPPGGSGRTPVTQPCQLLGKKGGVIGSLSDGFFSWSVLVHPCHAFASAFWVLTKVVPPPG